MKPRIFLDPDGTQDFGLLVIVEARTGVVYTHQCAGLLNEVRNTEGFIIPLGEPLIAGQLTRFFHQEFDGHAYSPEADWTAERKATLCDLIGKIPCWDTGGDGTEKNGREFLKLDETRFSECTEAWLPVLTPYGKGILVHKNSD